MFEGRTTLLRSFALPLPFPLTGSGDGERGSGSSSELSTPQRDRRSAYDSRAFSRPRSSSSSRAPGTPLAGTGTRKERDFPA